MIEINRIDHFVMRVADVDVTFEGQGINQNQVQRKALRCLKLPMNKAFASIQS